MEDKLLIRKDLVDKIINCKCFDNVKLLRGVCGSGKSTLLKQLMDKLIDDGVSKDNIISMSLFAFDYYEKNLWDVYESFKNKIEKVKGKTYLFLDEVEGFKNWQSLVKWISRDFDCEVYATINYSKFLHSDDSVLIGKSTIFDIYPFSFKEFKEYHDKFGEESKSEKELFTDYVREGGMPYIIFENSNINSFKQLFELIIKQDFVKYNDLDYFTSQSFVEYMIWRFCEKFSKKSLDKYEYVEMDNDTLFNTLNILKDYSLMIKSPIYYDNHRFRFDEKYYMADHGFYRIVYNDHTWVIDKILRNIIFVELLRRGYKVFFVESGGRYVDFLAYDYEKHVAIQFDFLFLNDSIAQKEIDDLNSLSFPCEKYIMRVGNLHF